MSDTPHNPPLLAEDTFVTFWDIVRRQFFMNRVAAAALYSLLVVIVLAIAAPLVAMNVPYVMWEQVVVDGKATTRVSWPLFIKLFDGHVFGGGVDIFFNVLLVILPLWVLGAGLLRNAGLAGQDRNRNRALAFGIPFGLLMAFYLYLCTQSHSRYPQLLACAGFGIAIMAINIITGKGHTLRERKRRNFNVRLILGGVIGLTVLLMVQVWGFTGESITYRTKLAELERTGTGGAITPPVFFHPDNRNDDQSYILDRTLQAPSFKSGNILGCDNNGRDVFTRLVYGSRISLTIGIVAVSIYVTIGIILGSLAGYFGRRTDMLIMFLVQVMMCIPGLFLILTIVAFFDNRSIFMIMIAIGLTGWTGITRLVRGEFFRQRSIEYVTAAKCLGIPERKIIFGHILKNSVGPVLVSIAFGIAGAVLSESFLSFLGLGDTNAPSWGQLLQEGRTHRKAWLLYSPGLAIFYLVTVLNLVGEGLRDALDPKLRH